MIGYRKDSVQKIFDVPWKQIVSLGQQTMLDQQVFSVSWILGRFCNYACSYCWPYAHSNTPDFQDFDIYTQTIDSIKAQARQNKFNRFHWSFSGGEPTAYKKSFRSCKTHRSRYTKSLPKHTHNHQPKSRQ